MSNSIQKIVIVGGGTAGWMTAAAMSKLLNADQYQITLVESPDIANVGVGEATIPQIQLFNELLGINENDFVKKTQATFKHGIEFKHWKNLKESYIHPFGTIGLNFEGVDFHHYWVKMVKQGKAKDLQDYAFNSVAAKAGKMMRSVNVKNSPLSNISYAYHFDASLYVEYLKEISIKQGIKHIVATVKTVTVREDNGFIDEVILENGLSLQGDLYIDCSGFKGLLIEQALHTGWQDWGHWLPCDRAIVAPSKHTSAPEPYTRSTAQTAGWQWRIPLQHRMGNGFVYSSKFMDDDEAEAIFRQNIEGELLEEPRIIRFKAGVRNKFWHKNCVAIGLSSGFVEPLESTAIHIMQTAISRLMTLFPTKDMPQILQDTYNKQSKVDMERIRDFIIVHYKVTQRDDSAFWRYCQNMEVPDNLHTKIKLFTEQGLIFREEDELFNPSSWLSVMVGQGVMPQRYHSMVDNMPEQEIETRLNNVEEVIKKSVSAMPTQAIFINENCLAPKVSL